LARVPVVAVGAAVSGDTFSGYPPSIAETRAKQAHDGKLWTPRDALIDCLRDIDEGRIKPVGIVICISIVEGDDPHNVGFAYRNAGRNLQESLGLLERVKHSMQEP
jgi:hypothetical protein